MWIRLKKTPVAPLSPPPLHRILLVSQQYIAGKCINKASVQVLYKHVLLGSDERFHNANVVRGVAQAKCVRCEFLFVKYHFMLWSQYMYEKISMLGLNPKCNANSNESLFKYYKSIFGGSQAMLILLIQGQWGPEFVKTCLHKTWMLHNKIFATLGSILDTQLS